MQLSEACNGIFLQFIEPGSTHSPQNIETVSIHISGLVESKVEICHKCPYLRQRDRLLQILFIIVTEWFYVWLYQQLVKQTSNFLLGSFDIFGAALQFNFIAVRVLIRCMLELVSRSELIFVFEQLGSWLVLFNLNLDREGFLGLSRLDEV